MADGERLPTPEKLHAFPAWRVRTRSRRRTCRFPHVDRGDNGIRRPEPASRRSLRRWLVLPAPTTTTVPCISRMWPVLYAEISSSALSTPFCVFARNAEPLHRAKAEAEEDVVELGFESLQRGGKTRSPRRSGTRRRDGESSPLREDCRRRGVLYSANARRY